jgi:hypothetical protein
MVRVNYEKKCEQKLKRSSLSSSLPPTPVHKTHRSQTEVVPIENEKLREEDRTFFFFEARKKSNKNSFSVSCVMMTGIEQQEQTS